MKVFARKKKIYDEFCSSMYYNYNIANAAQGFHDMGFELIDYYTVDEIYDKYEKGDIALDGIKQVDYLLAKHNIKPQNFDYPEVLNSYLNRKIWKDTINHVSNHPELFPVFVKSIEDKVLTGKLITSIKDLIGYGSCYNDTEIYCSEPVNFVYECRGFIYYDELIDLRPYRGNYKHMSEMNTTLISQAIKDFTQWEERPNACSLDFGITDKGETVLIEMNSAYSLACYGLDSIQYAKLISAYISQISNTKDECKFN